MKNAGGFLIGAGITLLFGYVIYNSVSKKSKSSGGSSNDGGGTGGSGSHGGYGTPPKPQDQITPDYSGKKVSDLLKTNAQNKFAGLPLYSTNDGVQVYTTVNTPYQKAEKGQLLGTFAGATVNPYGGWFVNIKTTGDAANPFVKANAAFLKF